MTSHVTAIRDGIHISGVSPLIWDALGRFVVVLCDGAFDTEGEHAPSDVIALAYVMPPWETHNWGAWPEMIREWWVDGRAPKDLPEFWERFGSDPEFAADLVAGAVADGLAVDLLRITDWVGGREQVDPAQVNCITALAALSPKHGERLAKLCARAVVRARMEVA